VRYDYPLKYDEINTNTILISSILLLGASFVINYFLSIKIFIISLIIATLWILYAFPKFLFLKSSYTGALFVHYINGNLHFLIGYILFNKISAQAILLSQFFALIFIAGYFHHILKDRETDKLMGIKNLANKYSPSFIFFIGNLIFFISYLYLGVLVILKLLPYLFFIYNTLIIIFLYITYNKIRKTDLSKSIILKYRTYYRFLYSIYGILMVLTILQSEWNKLIN
jgi:4-hydroxybenzoate polyprenyltransferase